jgi:hypothetical protein
MLNIPKHGGPDGTGLNEETFTKLLDIMKNNTLTDHEKLWSLNLCFNVSKQAEWNENYRLRLLEIYKT